MEKDLHTGSRNQILNLKQVQLPAMQLLESFNQRALSNDRVSI